MEHRINETFEVNGKTYRTVAHRGCSSCAFTGGLCLHCGNELGPCAPIERADQRAVIFVPAQ